MNNKGNQKHLTFEQRVEIEKGLTENKSFATIARMIGKDPSTISKEVRLHAHTKQRPDAGYTNPPCIHRKECKIVCLCDEQCGTLCKICKKPDMRCIQVCPGYETAECDKLNKPPYVCNGCGKKHTVLCQGSSIHPSTLRTNIAAFWLTAELALIRHRKAFRQ